MDGLTRARGAALVAGAAALTAGGCGSVPSPPGGTLAAHAGGAKLGVGQPADPGQDLTVTEMALTFRDGRGIVVESIRPLGLSGNARYLGGALLLPPRQGFELKLAHGFPRIDLQARWARPPYVLTTARGSINVAVGFALRKPGVTRFAGLAVRYRQRGREYVTVMPLGIAVCVPAKRWARRCRPPTTAEIPDERTRRA